MSGKVAVAAGVTAALGGLLLHASFATAVSTRQFVLDDAGSFAAGEMDGTAVHSNGSVTAGMDVRRIAMPDVPVAYSFVVGRDGDAFIGTGNEGVIYRLRGDTVSVFARTGQLLVSSLTFGEGGRLIAGTLPEGRIFSVDAQGRATELARPSGAEHVWSLVYDARRRTLFAATGPEGKVFSIDAVGRPDVYFDSEAAHVMSLALDSDGTLYAGTSNDAVVYRLRAKNSAEVVYDFPGNEITALAVRGGVLAVAANEFGDAPSGSSSPTPTKSGSRSSSPRPQAGKGKLFRVGSDGRAEQVYQNNDAHFTSVQLAPDGTIYAGAGKDGRIFRVSPDRTSSTWIDVDERQVLAIDLLGSAPMFVASDAGAIYRVLTAQPREAVWTGKVLDAQFVARWGALRWRGSGTLELQTRSGNTTEVDDTWSEWSNAINTPGPIRSPASRFLQVRARFTRDPNAVLHALSVFYLPQNQRAVVRNVRVKADQEPASSDDQNRGNAADQVPPASTTYKLVWDVDNPDGDRLRYRLRFRGEGQTVWRPILRDDVTHTRAEYAWDTSAVPDGYYVVQVEASDELANPASFAVTSAAESEPILIDNHAPRLVSLRVVGGRLVGRAVDSASAITRLELSVDGGEWRLFFPDDDLLDSRDEGFTVDLASTPPGEHIFAVRAVDAGGNTASGETVARTGSAGQRR